VFKNKASIHVPGSDAANSAQKYGEQLKAVPILASYSEEERQKLGVLLEEKKFSAGGVVFRQGDPGDGFYIVTSGTVAVSVKTAEGPKEIARLSNGDYFGEGALINNKPRGADITAITDLQCLYLSKDLFAANFTNITFAKRAAVSAETGSKKEEEYKAPEGCSKEKNPDDINQISISVATNMLWSTLDDATRGKIIAEMHKETIVKGTVCMAQGDRADLFYVIKNGAFEVIVDNNKVGEMHTGKCFGEAALMYNAPRKATVIALEDTDVWVIHRSTFRNIVKSTSSAKLSQYANFLKAVSLLAPLSSMERGKISDALEEVVFEAGSTVFEQGSEGNAMYFVVDGTAGCVKDGEEVATCSKGDYFGERALIKDDVRAATVLAKTRCVCLKLDREAFDLLLGPLENIMKKHVESYDSSGGMNKAQEAKATESNIPFEELKVIGTLGKGSFGYVQLVKDSKETTYALKAVSKQMIVDTQQQGHIMNEKEVIAKLKHPFLVRLHQTYKDKDRLYFLFEPVLGGELFTILRAQTLFDEPTATFFAACVLSAFEHMHSFDIVYRDLKPENLLIDKQGFVKITDFGFAKHIGSAHTFTLCGTPDYLAPEIVAGKGHGKGVDWWTLGILIYEMLASYPPFYQEDPMLTYSKILQSEPSMPSYFSKNAVSILKKLLNKKASKRLGVVKGGAKLIKKQPWFESIDFDKLVARNVTAPIIPKIKDDFDLQNFEDVADEEPDVCEPYTDDGSNWDANF